MKLLFLQEDSVELPERKLDPETGKLVETGDVWTMSLHSLDNREDALCGKSLDDLAKIVKRAKKLVKDIGELKRTPLVRELVSRGVIRKGDLLHRVDFPHDTTRFEGLLNLRRLGKNFSGSQKYPDRTELLTDLLQHVRESTGDWHDELVAPLLEHILPKGPTMNKPSWPVSKKGLSEWRKRHNLT